MTKRELILALANLPDDAEVYVQSSNPGTIIENIKYVVLDDSQTPCGFATVVYESIVPDEEISEIIAGMEREDWIRTTFKVTT